jgi:hypothetical protein
MHRYLKACADHSIRFRAAGVPMLSIAETLRAGREMLRHRRLQNELAQAQKVIE